MNIAVCDDISAHATRLAELIGKLLPGTAHSITLYSCSAALLAHITCQHVDILFLDVELPGDLSGVELARQINLCSPETRIVFVTAYPNLSSEVSEAEYCYFLLKPVEEERLSRALRKCVNSMRQDREKLCLLPLVNGTERVFSGREVLYFERVRRLTRIWLATKPGTLDTRMPLSELEALLPTGLFSRPHNSFLVNLRYVSSLARSSVTLEGGIILPISNQRRNEFRQALSDYITVT